MQKRRIREENQLEAVSGATKKMTTDWEINRTQPTQTSRRRLTRDDYTVGWICALEVEQTAALEMLDEEHDRLPQPMTDNNVYNLGCIASHNVVITGLSRAGNNIAATVVAHMRMTFPNLKFGLLVGIGGGVPVKTDNGMIRLGDVVVSQPANLHSGAVQYDYGKAKVGHFECRSSLARPPVVLLNAAQDLSSKRARLCEDPLLKNISRINTNTQGLRKYKHPGPGRDHLFKSDYIHLIEGAFCNECGCDPSERVQRSSDDGSYGLYVNVHRGTIASGGLVVKDAVLRDQLAEEYGVLCFEMEAAGTLTDFPCLVIRGISDYSDSHKNNEWHGYAAAAAAAYARQLFFHMPIHDMTSCVLSAESQTPPSSNETPISVDSLNQIDDRQMSSKRLTHSYVLPVESQTFPFLTETQKRMLVDSLRFDQIDARQMSIKGAHMRTCEWLLKKSEYFEWLDPAKSNEHHGFLWIKGKPGIGKSTLMKFAVHNSRKMEDRITISFFFHARGSTLEKSIVGMYRSLLLQLLKRLPELQIIFASAGLETWNGIDCPEWSVELLKNLFRQAILLLGQSSVMCFIDALDECDESQIRDMVMFFQRLGELAVSENIYFRVCFSSRHYPHISISKHVSLALEGQEGHVNDIASYIDSELRLDNSSISEQLRTDLRKKASGVFMWVVIVVGMLKKDHDEGRSTRRLRKTLQSIPDDLHELFHGILTQDDRNNDELLLCIQWLLFARRPLRPEELYFAILSGTEPEDLTGWDLNDIPMDKIKKFILNCSKGLAEITEFPSPTVQFIHESVADFFLKKNGLTVVSSGLEINFRGQSHERLKQCSLNYMNMDAISQSKSPCNYRDWPVFTEFPFLRYARRNVLYHADAAEGFGVTQRDFISDFQVSEWMKVDRMFPPIVARRIRRNDSRRYSTKASLLYILAATNMSNLIRIHPSNLSYFEVEDENWGVPLFAAIGTRSNKAVRAILEVQAEALAPTDRIHNLCKCYYHEIIEEGGLPMDFRFMRQKTPLSHAAMYCSEVLLEILLATKRWMPDIRDEDGRTPLSNVVSQTVNQKIVNLLPYTLQHQYFLKDSYDWRLLSDTAKYSHRVNEVIKLLLKSGKVEVDSKDNDGRTPLSYAIESGCGNEKAIELLLELGNANADLTDGFGRTPASYAATNKCYIQGLIKKSKEMWNGVDKATSERWNVKPVYRADRVTSLSSHMSGCSCLESSDLPVADARTKDYLRRVLYNYGGLNQA
ncbi:hypothetical protein EMCG_00985 [[Emmonsia] crescens]|uniref:Nephrocystin 3-like N-terminal domain-containing protein n=1 Tax=[Emmonsia] crescens TaxID=73230 RepID=A0A0G2JC91_9EURO|nr:hypothetical protein EMCG_00985 [Emmonsia crescens UAMH 3008]